MILVMTLLMLLIHVRMVSVPYRNQNAVYFLTALRKDHVVTHPSVSQTFNRLMTMSRQQIGMRISIKECMLRKCNPEHNSVHAAAL